MPTAIILSSVISSWPILWAIFGGAAAAVVVLATFIGVATRPRRHGSHARHAIPEPGTAEPPSRAASDQHALV
jgi:hypothetical protein